MKIAGYETDLTEGQSKRIEPMLPAARKLGRKRTSLRRILDALLYSAKAGCQWRLLPVDLPPWQTVYAVFRKWITEGLWAGINARLRALVRAKAGKRCRPTAAILDSQSVKSDLHGEDVGYDAGKKINGCKRRIVVDTVEGGPKVRHLLVRMKERDRRRRSATPEAVNRSGRTSSRVHASSSR